VEVWPEIDSSNSELMRRARSGRCDAVLLVAERQTAGRGRLGRSWHSEAGQALTFSLGVPLQPSDWSGLSLAVGVSVAEALEPAPPAAPTATPTAPPRIQLKWPNDLWCDNAKLAGILVETAGAGAGTAATRYLVVGIGVNLQTPVLARQDPPPIGLNVCHPGVSAPVALQWLAPPLARTLRQFEREGLAPFVARFDRRDLLRDRRLCLSNGVQGHGRGVTASGALRVQTEHGMQEITSAQWSVRPC